MIFARQEYQRISQSEKEHWWYRCLHWLVLKQLRTSFGDRRDLRILDAGCGTGGLMSYLAEKGYNDIVGFDLGESALQHCRDLGLRVELLDILEFEKLTFAPPFDAIICNDVLSFLDDFQRREFLGKVDQFLVPGGLFLSNNAAFRAFSGIHDICIHIADGERFERSTLATITDSKKFEVVTEQYWPLLLSPLIYFVRLLQRTRLRMGIVREMKSDVDVPLAPLNWGLYFMTWIELMLSFPGQFGSSIFFTLRKRSKI